MYGCNGMMGGWGWLGGLFSLLVVALIIGGVLLAIRQFTRPTTSGPASPASSAEAILAERYARGEIDDHEYQQRLAILRTGR